MLKLCVAAFILVIAELWSPILSLEWYWYGIIFIVTYNLSPISFIRNEAF